MAVTAREVIMVFRGQNYLSGAIRRVGADMSTLSRANKLSVQQSQLRQVAQRVTLARSAAETERRSIQNGTRRIALEQRFEAIQRKEVINAAQLSEAQVRASRLDRFVNARRPLRGFTLGETAGLQQAAQRRLQAAQQAIAMQDVELRKLIADETALTEREAQLTQIINNRTRALALNTAAQERNNFEATKIEPIRQWQARAQAIEHAGRAMQMFGLITVAAVGYAADSAAKLNTQITLAATQAREPGKPATRTAQLAGQLQSRVLSTMRQLPFSSQDISDAFYQVFSGTNIQNISKATDLVETFGKAAVAGGTDLKTMVDVGITLHNVFGNEFKTATAGANAFAAAVRYGRMNSQQFASALPNVAAIAKAVGLSFQDIAGAMAVLTRQTGGRFTSRDATGIARMIEVFGKPEFIAGAKKMGVNIKDAAGNMRPLLDIIGQFSAKTKNEGGIDLINLFKTVSALGSTTGKGGSAGTIQARRAFQFLIKDVDQYRKVSGLVRQDNDEMQKSFEAMSKTPGVQWQLFINQIKVLVYEIGVKAIPAFIQLGKPIKALIDWFDKLSSSNKKLIADFLVFGGAAGLILGTVLAVGGGLASLILKITLFSRVRAFNTLIMDAELAGEAIGGLSLASEAGFVSVGVALAGAIPLLIIFHKQVGQIVSALGGWYNVMQLLASLFVAFKMTQLIGGFSGLAVEIGIASTAALGLEARLAALAKIGPIAIAVALSFIPPDKNPSKAPGSAGGSPVGKFFAGLPVVGGAFSRANQLSDYLNTQLGILDPSQEKGAATAKKSQTQSLFDIAGSLFHQKLTTRARTAIPSVIDAATKAVRTPAGWIQMLEKARAKMLANPSDIAAAQKYENLQNQLNTTFKEQPALLAAINDVLGNYNQNLKTGANQVVTMQDALSGLQNMYKGFNQQETGLFGTLFAGPYNAKQDKYAWGGRMTGMDALRDIRSQVGQFKTFHGELDKLQKRGASQGLIQQLIGLGSGPDQIRNLQALNSLSPQQLRQYFNAFKQGQDLIKQQTMRDLNNQLKLYRQHGRNIALAIIAGLRDEQVGVTGALTKMLKKMFPGLPTSANGAAVKPTVVVVPTADPSKSGISAKNQQRHHDIANRNRYTGKGPGPR